MNFQELLDLQSMLLNEFHNRKLMQIKLLLERLDTEESVLIQKFGEAVSTFGSSMKVHLDGKVNERSPLGNLLIRKYAKFESKIEYTYKCDTKRKSDAECLRLFLDKGNIFVQVGKNHCGVDIRE